MFQKNNILLMVLSAINRVDHNEAEAILLSPYLSYDLPTDQCWNLWAMSETVTNVICNPTTIDSIYIENKYELRSTEMTVKNNIACHNDIWQDIGKFIVNDIIIDITPPIMVNNYPFFLVPFRDWKTRKIDAELHLNVTNISELPHFKSFFSSWGNSFVGMPLMTNEAIDHASMELLDKARICKVTKCKWLQFGLYEQNWNCGVIENLHLIDEQRIYARIHLPNDMTPIKPGIVLTQETIWSEENQIKHLKVDIAEILKIIK